MTPELPIFAHDILGIFNRDAGPVVRIKRPGRHPVEARIHPDDVPAFEKQREIVDAVMDVSMLWGWEEAE